MQKPCHCEASAHTGCGNPHFPTTVLPPAAPFLSAAKEREERTPPKPRFWNPFRGQETARSGTLQPRELSTAKFAPCFRIVSASPSATRSALVLAWRDGGNLCVCRVMRNISCHRFVGDDAHIDPPGKRGVWRGTWAPSYIVLRCRSRADRGVRSYKGNGFPHRCAHWFGMTG